MEDIKRLKRICKKLDSILDITYHMDISEYERFKNYIYARYGINMPLNLPANTSKKK